MPSRRSQVPPLRCRGGIALALLALTCPGLAAGELLVRPVDIDNLVSSRMQDPLEAGRVIREGALDIGCDSAQVVENGEVGQDQQCGIAALYFDVDREILGAAVASAVLRLTVIAAPLDGSGLFAVNPVAGPWSEDMLSLETAPPFEDAPEIPLAPPAEGTIVLVVDVTPIVQKWASGELANHGLYISQLDFEHPGRTAIRSFLVHSRDTREHPTDIPELRVVYTPRVPGVAPVVSLDALPLRIALGEPSTLSWASTGATECSVARLSPALDTPMPLGRSGQLVVEPGQTSEYRLRCRGPGGITDATRTVLVDRPGAGPTVSFEARPREVQPGHSTTLFWEATDVDRCSGSWAPTVELPPSGSAQVHPFGIQSYRITCTGASGSTSASTVAAASQGAGEVIVQLLPATIAPGETSEIIWRSTGADDCLLGAVADVPEQVGPSGSRVVSPPVTTRYEILCGNALASFQIRVDAVGAVFTTELAAETAGFEKLAVRARRNLLLGQKRLATGPIRMGEGRFELMLGTGTSEALALAGTAQWLDERKADLVLDPAARAELETRVLGWLASLPDVASLSVDKLSLRLKRPRSPERKAKLKLVLRFRTQAALGDSEHDAVYRVKLRGLLAPPP